MAFAPSGTSRGSSGRLQATPALSDWTCADCCASHGCWAQPCCWRLAILATAYFSGSLHRLWGLQHPWHAAVAYACWAFLQEFMLQCFCLRMLRALVSRVSSLLLSGVVFAVAHLPNPSLTFVTFFAGVAFTSIYARKRNLYVVALIHAVLGLTLAVSAPDAWFHGLRVGRSFLEPLRPSQPISLPRASVLQTYAPAS